MKAVVLHEYGGPEKLKYEDFPDPIPGDGEVLVRIAATSINPIDYKMRSGAAQARFPLQFPAILGRDLAGTVRSIGPNVTGFAPGDKVIGLGWATYAELTVIKADILTHLPEGLDPVEPSSSQGSA
jgi:NADPH:quinone reductase-like Zn-dependent oxidoreductase